MIYKSVNISGTVGPIYFIFGHNILEGVSYHQVASFSWWWHHGGVHRCTKCIRGTFSGRKQGKIQPGVIPECFPGCPVSSITVIQFSLLCENSDQRKQEFLETRVLERQFFAPMAATMIYYEDCMTLPGWFYNTTLYLNSELIYMFALWNPDDMCYEVREPVFIYTARS